MELMFIPTPSISHLMPMVELAKLLTKREDRLMIKVFIMKQFSDSKVSAYIESLNSNSISNRIQFIDLPAEDEPTTSFNVFSFIESQKPLLKDVLSKLTLAESSSKTYRVAAFVLDMFCTPMIDVANEFGIPTYIYYTSSASALGFTFYFQTLHDEHNQDIFAYKDSDTELVVPSFVNKVPAKVLPSDLLDNSLFFINQARRFKETKGIIINTFMELEPFAINSFLNAKTPLVYPVGPIMNLKGETHETQEPQNGFDVIKWLDDQPLSSVVFLCFGSMGSFEKDQVKEIAYALEHSGCRFLWSLRKPPPSGGIASPSEYTNLEEILPQGFINRTQGLGKVIGWAPQVAILAHSAIGGFVSHCGWNSTLESLWFGVPIATWPIYAEQQINAFEMVKELRLAVEVKMDYSKSKQIIVTAMEIERGIREVMDPNSEIRKNVKEIKEIGRKALMDGGSSLSSLDRLIVDLMGNITHSDQFS
ncbi:hypothetical protein SO802_010151 [Lithocarpus litseifolius]|uniref:Glycosyltransferase n=1 Tax=Lithocarpus litseifolius TaxID=425828 RepID=A0AAW2DGH6_9ROSI